MLIDFRQLFPKYGIKPKGVLHVGANVGEEAPVYLELGVKHQIWIEANPVIYEKLKGNLLLNSGAKAFNVCIGDIQGERVTFHISNNGSQSSSILELGTHKIAHPEVTYIEHVEMFTDRIDVLFDSLEGYDFLNIDLQGAELKALKGMGELLHGFKWAYLEVNKEELYKGCALFPEVEAYMNGFGFKVKEVKWCGNTGWGDCFMSKD